MDGALEVRAAFLIARSVLVSESSQLCTLRAAQLPPTITLSSSRSRLERASSSRASPGMSVMSCVTLTAAISVTLVIAPASFIIVDYSSSAIKGSTIPQQIQHLLISWLRRQVCDAASACVRAQQSATCCAHT
jgi:hypothetical protein